MACVGASHDPRPRSSLGSLDYVRKRLCPACNGHGFVDQVMQVEPLVTRKHLPRVQTEGLRMNRKLAGLVPLPRRMANPRRRDRTRCRVFGRHVP
jgi:hypothetical protein